MQRRRSSEALTVSPPTSPARADRQVRWVAAALCTVVGLLAVLAVLQAAVGQRATDRLERSGDLVEAYLVIGRAVARQDAIEESYEDEPGTAQRRRFAAASRRMDRSLATLASEGAADDRALAGRFVVTAQRYRAGMAAYFAAVDAGDRDGAEQIDENRVDVWSGRLATLATEIGPVHAAESLHEIDGLRRSQHRLLIASLVAIPLGGLVLAALAAVLRSLRRRLAAAQAAELERLERDALTDNLTGIGNQRAFEQALPRDLARSAREDEPVALVMLDLDGLKAVNDGQGHLAGDRMIRAAADALRVTARAGDGVFRIGGDEYAAILPATSAEGAQGFARRVHAALAAEDVAGSAGICVARGPASPSSLVERADAALKSAKRERRETVVSAACSDPVAA